MYPLFSIFAFLGFLLVLVPLPAWNSGTCFYMMWAALACLNQFVNSVVWADDMVIRAPGWCDISIRITMAASVGIPAASLCITRRLYHIASVKTVPISKADKRRAALVDALICVFFPLVYLAFQYIVQGHRFNIYEQLGCYPALYNSIPMYFLSMMWPPLLGLISAIYGAFALRAFLARRAAFTQFLSPASGSGAAPGLTATRYLRLIALSLTSVLLTLPLGIFAIAVNATATPVGPWVSLADTHFDFARFEQVPAVFWRSNKLVSIGLEFTRWAAPASALVFVAFFGAAAEARKNYSAAFRAVASLFWRVASKFGLQRP
ncbi:fungal pheromone STE3G-protein-coupled receptor, partial [Mycena belliarum]